VLFKWIPILISCLRSCILSLYTRIDTICLRHLRFFVHRLRTCIEYIIFFYWLRDISAWTNVNIFKPLILRMNRLLEHVVYIFGCYWLVPLIKKVSRICLTALVNGIILVNRNIIYAIKLIGKPIFLILLDQLHIATIYVYRIALQPVIRILYNKYKVVEDLLFIHVLGPVFKRVVDSIPENNPFSQDSDSDLRDFMPSFHEETDDNFTVDHDEFEPEFSRNMSDSDSDLPSSLSLDHKTLASGLQRTAISDSDSDDLEFFPLPRKRAR